MRPMLPRRLAAHADLLFGLAALAWAAAVLFSLENPASLDDGLRHFAYAKASLGGGWTEGWSRFFYEGRLADLRTDPWFLADVLMAPFAALPAVPGIKLFTLAAFATVIAALLTLLRSFTLTPGWRTLLLAVALLGHPQWLGRALIGRPFPLVTAAALLTAWAVLRRRDALLAVILAASVLLSQLFVFPLLVAAVGVAWRLSLGERRAAARAAGASAAGVAAGFLLHPHPGEYLSYVATVFLRIPFLRGIGLSSEMESGLGDLWAANVAVAAACVILLGAAMWRAGGWRPMHRAGATYLGALCGGLLCAYALWVRAVDVLWPLLAVLAGSLCALDPAVRGAVRRLAWAPRTRVLTAALLLVLPLQALSVQTRFLVKDGEKPLEIYAAVDTLPPGARVLNADWRAFFGYFLRRQDLRYATGIDPSFTYLADPEVHALLEDLRTAGSDEAAMASIRALLDAWPSDYLALTSAVFPRAVAVARSMPDLQPVVVDGPHAVFRVR